MIDSKNVSGIGVLGLGLRDPGLEGIKQMAADQQIDPVDHWWLDA
jgi:hypothetical protein